MGFWLIVSGMTLSVLICLLIPLFRQRQASTPRSASELAVYKDHFLQLNREVDSGLLSEQEAEAIRVEISRRMLAADKAVVKAPDPSARTEFGDRFSTMSATLLVAMVPMVALTIYFAIGSPGHLDAPLTSQQQEHKSAAKAPHAGMEASISRLTDKLKQDPNNINGWILLARTYSALQRFGDAEAAYRRAADLSGGRIDIIGDLAETLVKKSGGIVTGDVSSLFEKVLKATPKDPRARYFLGLARAQAGKGAEAIEMWLALEADFPADAPWRRSLRQLMERTATRYGVDLDAVAANRPGNAARPQSSGPAAEAVSEAQSLTPNQRLTMIRSMVARLASRLEEDPDDVDGWLKLVRSYTVLGDAEAARMALRRAAGIAVDKPAAVRARITAAAQKFGIPPEEIWQVEGAVKKRPAQVR